MTHPYRGSMAKGWKRVAEVALHRSGAAGIAERRRRPSLVILAYHNVVPRGEDPIGDASLHVDQDVFADQLDWLLEGREIVGLGEALPVEPGDEAGSRIVITFDDAYRGTMTAGLEELGKRGVPATVFVPPGLLGSEGFWWDRLAVGTAPLDGAVRDHALGPLRGRGQEILEWARAEEIPIQDVPVHARPVAEDELLAHPGPGPLTLGAHTWSHPNLAMLDRREVAEELARSKEWLRARTQHYVDWLAYPYGMANEGVEDAAAGVFDASALVAGGAAVIRGARLGSLHRVPRLNVPRGLSLEGLALRLAGLV